MMKSSSSSLVSTLLLVSSSTLSSAEDSIPPPNYQSQCTLYLAPSVPGMFEHLADGGADRHAPRLGVFAGVDFAPGSSVGYGDIVVPVVDVRAQIGTRTSRFSKERKTKQQQEQQEQQQPGQEELQHHAFDWHWSEYVWEPRALGAGGEGIEAKAAAPGLGSLVRGSHLVEPNVMPARAVSDTAGLHRSRDPNAGSISYYHGMKTIATKPIEAGAELFSDFGMHYYSERDFLMLGTEDDHPDSRNGDETYEALLNGRADGSYSLEHDGAGKANVWGMLWNGKDGSAGAFKRLLPQVFDGAASSVSVSSSSNGSGTAANKGNHSAEWLNTHGYCLDNIVPGPSTIDKAGRGAFAARAVPAGSVIAPAPVVHLPDRDVLDLRAVVDPDSTSKATSIRDIVTDRVTGKQLLLNYCFGHPESTMLLCPVGAVTALINHAPSPSRVGGSTSSSSSSTASFEPNAEIRWSRSANMSNASWLNMSVNELDEERGIGLVLEYVALRDIRPEEEILIDYGREWDEAWKAHVESWKPSAGSDQYVDASSLNNLHRRDPIRTITEQVEEPYPSNVQTSCYYDYVPDAGIVTGADQAEESRVVTRRWLNGMDRVGTNLRPCRILEREGGGDDGTSERYTARILNCDETHRDALIPSDERVVVTDIPRRAIVFTNRLYTTDMHMSNVFRHEMIIPDDIFPNAWRNIEK